MLLIIKGTVTLQKRLLSLTRYSFIWSVEHVWSLQARYTRRKGKGGGDYTLWSWSVHCCAGAVPGLVLGQATHGLQLSGREVNHLGENMYHPPPSLYLTTWVRIPSPLSLLPLGGEYQPPSLLPLSLPILYILQSWVRDNTDATTWPCFQVTELFVIVMLLYLLWLLHIDTDT